MKLGRRLSDRPDIFPPPRFSSASIHPGTGMARYVGAPPKASILIESMRDIGYSLETAIADVVDNSISAGATRIDIHVDTTSKQISLAIVDDGVGMPRRELVDSMRLGSRHPREDREARDLGRFGLGMKTASFSQCRRLTVVSRHQGDVAAATWDLDHVEATDDWSLQLPDDVDDLPFVETLTGEGTLVLWQRLDRAVEIDPSEDGRRHFIRRMDEVSDHLQLVFHRFITGEPGCRKVAISMNGVRLKAFDPFHSAHSATQRGQAERVQVGDHSVEITPFTLPHHKNVTAAEWDRYAGRAGYLKNQGFYLYRERRLIVHGTWFGMARQTELTKLARVRIDMPNALDTAWHIDVKKASAQPPFQVRERLERVISALGAPSKRIYRARGARLNDNRSSVWQRVQENNQIVYRINLSSPILEAYRETLPSHVSAGLDNLLKTIAASLPMDAIFADLAGSPEAVRAEELDDAVLQEAVAATADSMQIAGVNADVISDLMRVMEPFRSHWERTEEILDGILNAD